MPKCRASGRAKDEPMSDETHPSMPKPPVLQNPLQFAGVGARFHARNEFRMPKWTTEPSGTIPADSRATQMLENGRSGTFPSMRATSSLHCWRYVGCEPSATASAPACASKKDASSISKTASSA